MAVAQHFLPRRQAFLVQRLGGVVLALSVLEPRQRDFQPQDLHLVRLLPKRRRRHRDDLLPQLLKDHGVDAGKAHGLPHRIEYAVAVFFSALMVASILSIACCPSFAMSSKKCCWCSRLIATSNLLFLSAVQNSSKRHQPRVNGMGSFHGANTMTVRPNCAMADLNVLHHQSKSKSTALC